MVLHSDSDSFLKSQVSGELFCSRSEVLFLFGTVNAPQADSFWNAFMKHSDGVTICDSDDERLLSVGEGWECE
jgi:hypothetical protein